MDKQKMLFENLKKIKDHWTQGSTEGLDQGADLIWSNVEEDYHKLQNVIISDEAKKAFQMVMNDTIMGVIHSILVMIDGGDSLADNFKLDLIDQTTKESLKQNTALHEEFYSYLSEVEE